MTDDEMAVIGQRAKMEMILHLGVLQARHQGRPKAWLVSGRTLRALLDSISSQENTVPLHIGEDESVMIGGVRVVEDDVLADGVVFAAYRVTP